MYHEHYNYKCSPEEEKLLDEMMQRALENGQVDEDKHQFVKKLIDNDKLKYKNRILNTKKKERFFDICKEFKNLAQNVFGELNIEINDNSYIGIIILKCSLIDYEYISNVFGLQEQLDDFYILAHGSEVCIYAEYYLYDTNINVTAINE